MNSKDYLCHCPDCGYFVTAAAIATEGYICKPCRTRRRMARCGSLLLIALLILALWSISGCAVQPTGAGTGAYRPGDVVVARMFTRFPQYEGELVTVKDGLGWKWIKGSWYQGNALRVYEIETSDGLRLAAQEFQLQRVK